METPVLLNLDQISSDQHEFEVLNYGLVLVTDTVTKDSFLLVPINPPIYLSHEDALYVRAFYTQNRAFTLEEQEILNTCIVPPDADLLETNCRAVLQWYEDLEKRVGPIATKPTPENLRNPLYWNECPVEVELQTGEVYPCALISQRSPHVPASEVQRVLLRDVVAIRPSPFAVPPHVLEVARKEGIEEHMGDARYAAKAGDAYYAVDAYYQFRLGALFFKNKTTKGSDLTISPSGNTTSLLSTAAYSEPITYVFVDGLW
jgi:hypothetical protein